MRLRRRGLKNLHFFDIRVFIFSFCFFVFFFHNHYLLIPRYIYKRYDDTTIYID
jgi:hypothetical protein